MGPEGRDRVITNNNPVIFIDPSGLCGESLNYTESGWFSAVPRSWSAAYPDSSIVAPTLDVITGGIHSGLAIASAAGTAATLIAGPEFWPVTAEIAPWTVFHAWRAQGSFSGAYDRLTQDQ